MNRIARPRRIALTIALAASTLVGSAATALAFNRLDEGTIVTGLTSCVLVDKAKAIGIPMTDIPRTVKACSIFKGALVRP